MFLKNKKVFFVLIVLALIGLGIFLVTKKPSTKPSPPSSAHGEGYKELYPGMSSKSQVIASLGQPKEEKTLESRLILSFPSLSPERKNEAAFEGETLVFFKEVITAKDAETIEDITKNFGEAKYVLFGPGSMSGFNLYVYPEKGFAYIGNPTGNTLLEVWYFSPVSIEEFKRLWAKGYSETYSPKTRY